MPGGTGRRWAVVTAVAGTVFIAAGAFWLSFTSLADLARRSGIDTGEAWAWPLIVDGIIVVATVAVVALGGTRAAWYPWALLIGGALVSVTANALHAVVAADATVPGGLAACVAAVPPIVLLAITHLTVVLTRTSTVESPGPEPADLPVTATANVVPTAGGVAGHVLSEPELSGPEWDEPVAGVASVLDRRGRAVELRGLGWSNKKIAREVEVHPSTVGRWFADAHLSDATELSSGPGLSSVPELSSAEETTP
ncbi:MAG: excisionase [Actinobacteria bacterium 69-20]|nr:DUF2637 domain-containing protein [Actinomycetota bacterium]OJV26272.1 MAG: excisionase [Actinobacteria bacterium 69-20]